MYFPSEKLRTNCICFVLEFGDCSWWLGANEMIVIIGSLLVSGSNNCQEQNGTCEIENRVRLYYREKKQTMICWWPLELQIILGIFQYDIHNVFCYDASSVVYLLFVFLLVHHMIQVVEVVGTLVPIFRCRPQPHIPCLAPVPPPPGPTPVPSSLPHASPVLCCMVQARYNRVPGLVTFHSRWHPMKFTLLFE